MHSHKSFNLFLLIGLDELRRLDPRFERCENLDTQTESTLGIHRPRFSASKTFERCIRLRTLYVTTRWTLDDLESENRHEYERIHQGIKMN